MSRIFGLTFLAIICLTGCGPSEAERKAAEKQRETDAMNNCKSIMTSNIESSCRADPEFAYCSLNYDRSEIMGSGCTNRIKNLPFSEKADFCIKESMSTVRRACAIEVYGCAAVTGVMNC